MLELAGIESWINSAPFSIFDQLANNKVVLVDFWTYTCVNCLRTFPFLRDWHAKYAERGLVIVGVHSPEFNFEKDAGNVNDAIEREGIKWPVALDNEFETWEAFRNRSWPAKYLIGPDSVVKYVHVGEGDYVAAEQAIRDALTEAGHDISGISIGTIENSELDPAADEVTRELYGGYNRNYSPGGLYAAQAEYYFEPEKTREYVDKGEYAPQKWYLHGSWNNGREAIIHARQTTNLEDYIAFHFAGRSANVVINPVHPEPFDVFVQVDDRPLSPDEAGADIKFDEQGRSYFTVTEPRLYAFIEMPEYGERIVKLASNSNNLAIFAFTFGIYQEGF